MGVLFERLQKPEAAEPAAPAPVAPAPAAPAPKAPAAEQAKQAAAGPTKALAPQAPAPKPAEGAPVAPKAVPPSEREMQPKALLRVRADVVDRLVNEAGEVAIARSRIEGELRTLKGAMQEVTDNVVRLRPQLRELQVQAEAQMQSRPQPAHGTE